MEMIAQPRQRRVVIADDDAEMRYLVARSLRKLGLTVVEACDGTRLLELLRDAGPDSRPDLVVSDIHMPGASGLDALVHLKAHLPDVPMVMISASGDAGVRARARELGANAVLDKPFDLHEFNELVITLLGY